ncbi:MAG: M20 family metallopeptidase [Rhodospirillales bacterium]|nr:M20 family metallopeptidase [Rhodospirillales bacterium]
MNIKNEIKNFHEEMTTWRRDIHAHPETAFEEVRTSAFVAEKLEEFGYMVHQGLAGTGVVGTLSTGNGPTIGLRADMDALHMQETNNHNYKSINDGKMHACGHDGHTTMLLGAAKYLAETKRFSGTIHLIFQPAEENEGGGKRMVEEGLFEKFPVEAVYGLHNWPSLPLGKIAVREGPMMAAYDRFDIIVKGRGAHAAMPNQGVDPIVIASQVIMALQTITSRTLSPLDSGVVTVTQIHSGDTYNVIPEKAHIGGTTRWFKEEVQDQIKSSIERIVKNICQAHNADYELDYMTGYPPTVNHKEQTELAIQTAGKVLGEENLILDPDPTMGAEDFSYMLKEKPGCYLFLGTARTDNDPTLHNPGYDFNDDALPIGASYWAQLVEDQLKD